MKTVQGMGKAMIVLCNFTFDNRVARVQSYNNYENHQSVEWSWISVQRPHSCSFADLRTFPCCELAVTKSAAMLN